MNEWHDFEQESPPKSGYYMVEDKKGRVFRTWYESTINGFNMIHDGTGFKIIRWKEADE